MRKQKTYQMVFNSILCHTGALVRVIQVSNSMADVIKIQYNQPAV